MVKVENMKKKMGRFSKTYGNDKIINLKAKDILLNKRLCLINWIN